MKQYGCCLLVVIAASLPAFAGDGDDDAPTRTLGTVTVTATRPTSLPTHIPTTIEGITGDEIAETINATDSEDALKYFPSLLVRKRYVGDYDHAVLASRASGTGNSARSLVYADGILLSNLLGNGATFTPRWGLVTPEEIERVDVLYGPFSAAYPGNSVGAVVDYVTRMPEELEMHARLTSFGQDFEIYDSRRSFHRLAGERLGGGSQRGLFLVAQLQSPGQRRTAALLRQQTRELGRRRQRRHTRQRRAARPQSAQPGLAHSRFHDPDPHDSGSRQGEVELRLLADAARELHARRVAQRCRSNRRLLSTRSGRQPGLQRHHQRRWPLVQRDTRGFRAEPWRPHARDARAVCQIPRRAASSIGKSPRAPTTTRTTSRARPRSRCRQQTPVAPDESPIRAAPAGTRWRCAAPGGRKASTAHTWSMSAISSTPTNCRRSCPNTADWIGGAGHHSLLGICRQDSAAERLRAGHLALCRRLARDARVRARALACLRRRDRQCDQHPGVRRTHRDSCLAKGRARLAAHARVGAEGVGRTRRAHADGVRAVPGFDFGRRDREQRSRSRSRRNPGPASSPRNASSAMGCCEPRISTKTHATRCIRRPTSPWFPTSPTSRTWITSARAAWSSRTRRTTCSPRASTSRAA